MSQLLWTDPLLRELIDTLWNVNGCAVSGVAFGTLELIDTLWNVNVTRCNHLQCSLGINRYIMECKSINGSNLTHDERVN